MSDDAKSRQAADVPAQVFEEFLTKLTAEGFPESVINSLRETIQEDDFNESSIRKALFGELS